MTKLDASERTPDLDVSQQDLPVFGFRLKFPPMAPALQRIDHIHVCVSDRKAAERRYADVLGLTPVADLESWAGTGPLTIGDPSGSVHLALFERPARECRSTVAFAATATEFLAWRSHLAGKLGKPVEVVNHDVAWSMYFTDPDGNPFEITSYEYDAVGAGL